ncbi:MAG TPA: hypothetical protein VL359_20180 [bacterium]|nr:hypothetical protein [bacterium]
MDGILLRGGRGRSGFQLHWRPVAMVLGLLLLLLPLLSACGSSSSSGSSGSSSSSTTYTPPASFSYGSGATIWVYATASAGAIAVGNVYVLINDLWAGTITGYYTGSIPSCGSNSIAAVSIPVNPGTYLVSAHDSTIHSWTETSYTVTSGCNPFGLN